MRISFNYIENVLKIEDEIVQAIEVENKKYFYRIVKDLYSLSSGEKPESVYIIDNDNNEINLNGKIKVLVDYFNFDFDSKKITNDVEKIVNDNISEENMLLLTNQYKKILKIYKDLLNDIDLPLEIGKEFDICNITKMLKINVNKSDDLLDNLLLLIDIEKTLKFNNILVFVNLKQYLTKDELLELYKYSIYNQIHLLLIDSQTHGTTIEYEKKLIIDNNLDEFVL